MGVPAWSKTAADNDDADSDINWAEGQAPSTVNNSARAMMAAVAEMRDDQGGQLSTAGSSNAYTVTTNSVYTAYANGMSIKAKANHSNTGAATLNVDSLGAKKIRKFTSSGEGALGLNDIVSGAYYEFVYNSALDAAAGGFEIKPTQATGVDITGTTAETAPAVADELLMYDASATANRKITLANLWKVIALLTAETSVATDDELALYDTSASATDKVTVQSLYNAINALTAETAPATDDAIALYDTSGSATDKITLANLWTVINGFTEDTSPDIANDFVATYDASATGVKKAKISSFCASASEIWGGSSTKPMSVANYVTALAEQSLTFAASLTPNGANGINFACTGVSSDFALNNFSNPVIGYAYKIRFVHSAANNNITSWGTDYEGINGTLPVLSTGSGDQDVLCINYFASGRALVWLSRDIS